MTQYKIAVKKPREDENGILDKVHSNISKEGRENQRNTNVVGRF